MRQLHGYHIAVAGLVAIGAHSLAAWVWLQEPLRPGALAPGSGGLQAGLAAKTQLIGAEAIEPAFGDPSAAIEPSDSPKAADSVAIAETVQPEAAMPANEIAQEIVGPAKAIDVAAATPKRVVVVPRFKPEPPPSKPAIQTAKPAPVKPPKQEAAAVQQPKPADQPVEMLKGQADGADDSQSAEIVEIGNAAENSDGAIDAGQASGGGAVSADYIARISALLSQNKRYSRRAKARRMQGLGEIKIVIRRDGSVSSAEITQQTGHSLLDRELLAVVERSQPFPPIPASLNQESFTLLVPMLFQLTAASR